MGELYILINIEILDLTGGLKAPVSPCDDPAMSTSACRQRSTQRPPGRPRLFHRDALGEVAWLIDIRPPEDRHVVSEQLQGDGVNHRRLHITHAARHLDDRDAVARADAGLGI